MTSFLGHCGQCGPGPLLDGHPCLCGHAEALHVLEQAVVLPPTGPCLESGCIKFQSNQAPAAAQDPAPAAPPPPPPTTSILSIVPSQAPPHSIWGRADSAQTADGRRRAAAVRHCQWTPAVSASMLRAGHRPFTMATTTFRINSASNKPPRELTFAIWPFPMWDPIFADVEYPDLYPMDFHLVGSEGSTLATALRLYGLVFKFQAPTKLDGSEDPDKDAVFHAELNTCVEAHMSKNHLRFSRFVPTDLPDLPITSDVDLINARHVKRLDALGWMRMASPAGMVQRSDKQVQHFVPPCSKYFRGPVFRIE
ncbi:hypothetical protein B0H14DRAFT_2645284 [Mycena olivaceomarginata]|nr:hypothetical protein B0H14DRAFT_2645284 [Mycena olivaceomarginata]